MKRLDLHGLDQVRARETLEHALGQLHSGDMLEIVHGYGASGKGGVLRTLALSILRQWEQLGRLEIDLYHNQRNPGATSILMK